MKIINFNKYNTYYSALLFKLKISKNTIRLLKVSAVCALLIHLFACFYFLTAKLEQFSPNTWVYDKELLRYRPKDQYFRTIYWACQTLTTVGYGEMNTTFHTNYLEMIVIIIWMIVGVFINSVGIGILTSVFIK